MASSTSKRYYKIREVSEMTDTPASTLRFWETQFPQLAPRRNSSGTRYYTPADVEQVRMIKYLVHDKGLRIEAALDQLRVNKDGVTKQAEAVIRLKDVRDKLQELIDTLHHLR